MTVDFVIPAVQVRRATTVDIKAIASLLRASFVEFEALYTSKAFEATTPAEEKIQARWDEGPVWVAVQTETLTGTVAAVPKRAGLYVRSMAVHPMARGQGIALQLLKVIEGFGVANHHKCLFLSTTPFLTSAIHLYEHFGFQRNDEGPHDLYGTPLFTMVKQLQSNEVTEPNE